MVNAFAFACLKSDFIDLASHAPAYLRKTKEGRQNAAYVATIVFQKKLLYHALVDDVPLGGVRLPVTDHILSQVFDRFSRELYTREEGRYLFDIDGRKVEMEVVDRDVLPKIRIRERREGRIVDEHLYW